MRRRIVQSGGAGHNFVRTRRNLDVRGPWEQSGDRGLAEQNRRQTVSAQEADARPAASQSAEVVQENQEEEQARGLREAGAKEIWGKEEGEEGFSRREEDAM